MSHTLQAILNFMQSSHFTVGNLDEILPGVFLGSIFATSPDSLRRHGIKAVLNVAGGHTNLSDKYPLENHLIINIDDIPAASDEMMKKVFPKALPFLDRYAHPHSPHRKRVLIHCMAGVSRSTTVLTAWLMKSFGMPLDEALKLIKTKRPIVNPNHGFMKILREYEHFIKRWKFSRPNGKASNFKRDEEAQEYAAKPKNASQQHFKSQADFLTPTNNLRNFDSGRGILGYQSNDLFSNLSQPLSSHSPAQSLTSPQHQSRLIDDALPNRWNNEIRDFEQKGQWKHDHYRNF